MLRRHEAIQESGIKYLHYYCESILYLILNKSEEIGMTVREIKKSVSEMKNFSKQTAQSAQAKTKARDFLVKTGVYTPHGKLTKAYK